MASPVQAAAEINEWLAWVIGKRLDPDEFAGLQCKDVADAYSLSLFGGRLFDFLGAGDALTVLTRADPAYWYITRYKPGLVPPRGAVLCYGGTGAGPGSANPYGHTAVCLGATPQAATVAQQDGFLQVPVHIAVLPYDGPGTGPCLGWITPRPEKVIYTGADTRGYAPLGNAMAEYVLETKWTTRNQVSRSFYGYPDKPSGITIHHWGNPGQRFENVCDFLSTNTVPTSAHYVVEAGRVACLAVPEVATFHAGSTPGNGATVGVECRPEMSAGDLAQLVRLVYELEQTYGDLNIYVHSDWFNTACAGKYTPRRADIVSRVNAMHANGGRDPGFTGTVKTQAAAPTVKAPTVIVPELDRKPVTDINGNVRTLRDVLNFRFGKYEDGLNRLKAVEAEVKALRAEINALKKAG